MKQAFTIDGAISFAWTKVKEQLGFFISFTILIFIIQLVNQFIQRSLENSGGAYVLLFLFIILSFLVSLVVGVFQIRIALDVADGKKAAYEAVKSISPYLGKALATQILYALIVIVGLILFFIPGIIWAIKYQYALYFVVDKNMSPFEALEASGKVTKGEKWHLFLFNLVIGLVIFAGLLALGIGLLIALPISMIAPGYVFRHLQKRAGGSSDPTITSVAPAPPQISA